MFHEEALGEATPALAGEAMVEARGVEKAYAPGDVRVHALRGVDLLIPRGEMVAGYAASLLTTFLRARQASKVYPAEALRYE